MNAFLGKWKAHLKMTVMSRRKAVHAKPTIMRQ